MPVFVDLAGMGVDVGGDLGLQRRGQHLPGAIANDLVEQQTPTCAAGLVGVIVVVDYLEHGRTFPDRRANAGPDQNLHGLQIFLGKVRHIHVTPPRSTHRF